MIGYRVNNIQGEKDIAIFPLLCTNTVETVVVSQLSINPMDFN